MNLQPHLISDGEVTGILLLYDLAKINVNFQHDEPDLVTINVLLLQQKQHILS